MARRRHPSLDAETPNSTSKIVFTEDGLHLNTMTGDRPNCEVRDFLLGCG